MMQREDEPQNRRQAKCKSDYIDFKKTADGTALLQAIVKRPLGDAELAVAHRAIEELGADIYAQDHLAMKNAVHFGNEKLVQFLLSNISGPPPRQALWIACMQGHEAMARLLLDHKARPDYEAAHRAAYWGHSHVLQLLLDRKLPMGEALYYAAGRGHRAAVELLLDRKADLHIEQDKPLRLAAGSGHSNVVELLLERRANLHALEERALQWSAGMGHSNVVRLLLAQRADLRVDKGRSLRHAREGGFHETAKLFTIT